MAWLTVFALSVWDWWRPAVISHRPGVRQLCVALASAALSVVADLSAVLAIVTVLPAGALMPGGLFGVMLGVLVADATFYCVHRVFHRNALWSLHRWHHAPDVMHVWVYYLGHPLFQWLIGWVRYAPLWLLGASLPQLVAVGSVHFVWSAFAHVNTALHLGRFEGWLLGPASHQLHHARGSGRNFGILLGVWDRFGGTLFVPRHGAARLRIGVKDEGPDAWHITEQLIYPFKAVKL